MDNPLYVLTRCASVLTVKHTHMAREGPGMVAACRSRPSPPFRIGLEVFLTCEWESSSVLPAVGTRYV